MKPTLLAATLAFAISSVSLAHGLDSATILPPQPTTDTPVIVRFDGWFSDGCPRRITRTIDEIDGIAPGEKIFRITLAVADPAPGLFCIQVITPFTYEVNLGHQPAGLTGVIDAVWAEANREPVEMPGMAKFTVTLGEKRGLVGATVAPSPVFEEDPITVTLHGLLITCIVDVLSLRAEVDPAAKRLVVVMRINIPPAECPGRPVDFSGSFEIGLLPAGEWSIDGILEATGDYIGPTFFPDLGNFEVIGDPTAGPHFLRGDANGDGLVDISDALFDLFFLFQGIDGPPCMDAADADDTGEIDITDPVYILSFLFLGGTAPPAPGAEQPGSDPTDDALGCDTGV